MEKKLDNPEKLIRKPSMDAVLKAVEEQTGVKREEIVSRIRGEKEAFAREHSGCMAGDRAKDG